MIATVCPAPVSGPEIPYTPLICAGLDPLTVHDAVAGLETSVKPAGYAYGETSWAHQSDSGGAFRKPAVGGAFLSTTWYVSTNAELSSSPTTPVTSAARSFGIASSLEGD